MVELKHSVRAISDPSWQRIQEIVRFPNDILFSNPHPKHEVINMVSQYCIFVSDWDSNPITPSTIILYARKVPAKEAMRQFVSGVLRNIHISLIRESTSQDLENLRFSLCEWYRAYESTSNQLDQQLKKSKSLLFFPGEKNEITYNKEGGFSQAQLALLIDVPTQVDLDFWRKIKVLIAPPGIKDIDYDPTNSTEFHKELGFKDGWIVLYYEQSL